MFRNMRLNKPNQLWLVFFLLLLLCGLGSYLSLRLGAIHFSHHELRQVLTSPLKDSKVQDIIIDIRLPRLIAAFFVGAAMAESGLMMQGITRNPIADPGLLGINAGAGLALILAQAFFKNLHYTHILIVCLLGSALATLLVFALSYRRGKGYNQLRLILAGAMVSTLFSAIGQATTLFFQLEASVIGWQAGGLAQTNWKMLEIVLPFILLGIVLSQFLAHQLNILSLNETVAKGLGQETLSTTVILLLIVLSLSAGAVAIVGSIAFVGLIIPHLLKMIFPKDYKLLLPITAFSGGTFLIWVDLLARTLNPPTEIPLGAIISMIGLPIFLWLIRRGGYL